VMTDAMREMLLIKTRQSFSRAQNLKERWEQKEFMRLKSPVWREFEFPEEFLLTWREETLANFYAISEHWKWYSMKNTGLWGSDSKVSCRFLVWMNIESLYRGSRTDWELEEYKITFEYTC
jgi:hypothetical protein